MNSKRLQPCMTKFKDRAKSVPGAIQAPATNLTIVSTIVAAVAAVATQISGVLDTIIGKTASPDVRGAVLIAIIAAAVVIVVADLLARAHVAASVSTSTHVIDLPDGALAAQLRMTQTPQGGRVDDWDAGWKVKRVRFAGDSDRVEYVLAKGKNLTGWEQSSDIKLVVPSGR